MAPSERRLASDNGTSLSAVFGYLAATYGVTWTLFFLARETETAAFGPVAFYAGVFTPGILASILTAWRGGRDGLGALLGSLVRDAVRSTLTMWLDDTRGQLVDWMTQRWVQWTGRRVSLADRLRERGDARPS